MSGKIAFEIIHWARFIGCFFKSKFNYSSLQGFCDIFYRVVFGPELVMLGPDEQFSQLSLSGGKPKKPYIIKSLKCLLPGPDFCTVFI